MNSFKDNPLVMMLKDWDYFLPEDKIKSNLQSYRWNTYVNLSNKNYLLIELAVELNLKKTVNVLCENLDNLPHYKYIYLWELAINNNNVDCLKLLLPFKDKILSTQEMRHEFNNAILMVLAKNPPNGMKDHQTFAWILNEVGFTKVLQHEIQNSSSPIKIMKDAHDFSGILHEILEKKNTFLLENILNLGYQLDENIFCVLFAQKNFKQSKELLWQKYSQEKINFEVLFKNLVSCVKNHFFASYSSYDYSCADALLNYALDKIFEQKTSQVVKSFFHGNLIREILQYSFNNNNYKTLNKIKDKIAITPADFLDDSFIQELITKKKDNIHAFIYHVINGNQKGQKKLVEVFLNELVRNKNKQSIEKVISLSKQYPWMKEEIENKIQFWTTNYPDIKSILEKGLLETQTENKNHNRLKIL